MKKQPLISENYDEFEELVDKKNDLSSNIRNSKVLSDERKKIELDNITTYFWGQVNEIVLLKQEQSIELARQPQTDFGEELEPGLNIELLDTIEGMELFDQIYEADEKK